MLLHSLLRRRHKMKKFSIGIRVAFCYSDYIEDIEKI